MKRMVGRLATTLAFAALMILSPLFTNIRWIGTSGYAASQDDDHGWTITSETLPFENILVNACAGEEHVYVSGQATIVTRQRRNASGKLQIKQDDEISATGVGQTSGAAYSFSEQGKIHIKEADPFPFSYVEHREQLLKGVNVPDQIVSFKIRLVILEDETIKRDVVDFRLSCK